MADLPFFDRQANRSRGDVSISVKDSPLPAALDMFFSFMIDLADHYTAGKQKMLINNVITAFDISQDTPYYDAGLFRNFADRVYMESPQTLGPANRADRFSLHYEQIIRVAASKIDRNYPQIKPDIDALRRELNDESNQLNSYLKKVADDWADIAQHMGIKPGDKDYEFKFINYLEGIRYADQVNSFTIDIDNTLGEMDAVRRAVYTTSEQILLDNLNEFSLTKKVARPRRPYLEREQKCTEATFADPTVRVESICDISPSAFPIGDLVAFLKTDPAIPPKTLKIDKKSVAKYQHDKEWGAGGSVTYAFFSIGANASGSSSYIQNISQTSGLEVGFANIAEYYIDRDLWYNPATFADPNLQKLFATIPGLDRLQYASISVIIARGLRIKLLFESEVDTTAWSKQSFAASGGVEVFGIGFGGSASYSTYDYSFEMATDRRSVEFIDDPQETRLLAVRVEPFIVEKPTRGGPANPDPKLRKAWDDFRAGKISYGEIQNAKNPNWKPPKAKK
jgi:hypothetical protein